MRQRMRQLLAPLLCAAAARALDSTPWGNYDGNGGLADVSALPAWRSRDAIPLRAMRAGCRCDA